jgi:hypothetical protein
MKTSYRGIRGLLWLICVYHVMIGVIAFMPPEVVRGSARVLLGLALPETPALYQVVKSLGVYALVFGVMMGVAAWDPIKNRALISVGVVLFALRIFQRLMNLDALEESFSVSTARNLGTAGVVAVIGGALAWLRWRIYQDMRREVKSGD